MFYASLICVLRPCLYGHTCGVNARCLRFTASLLLCVHIQSVLLITSEVITEAATMGMNKAHYLQDREKTVLDARIAFCIYCVTLACRSFLLGWRCRFFLNDLRAFHLENNSNVIRHCYYYVFLWSKTCESRTNNGHLLLIANKAWQT